MQVAVGNFEVFDSIEALELELRIEVQVVVLEAVAHEEQVDRAGIVSDLDGEVLQLGGLNEGIEGQGRASGDDVRVFAQLGLQLDDLLEFHLFGDWF